MPERLATGSADGTVKIWNTYPFRPRCLTLRGHEAPITALANLEDHCLASASADGVIKVWSVQGAGWGDCLRTFGRRDDGNKILLRCTVSRLPHERRMIAT